MTPSSDELLGTIKKSDLGQNNEVWVLLDKVDEDIASGKATFQLILYRLSGDVLYPVDPKDVDVQDLTDRDAWKIAIKYIYSNIKSKRKILYTWSHGAGFGINADEQDPGNAFISGHDRIDSKLTQVSNRFSYLSSQEVTSLNSLEVADLIIPISLTSGEYQMVEKTDIPDCKKIEVLWMSDLSKELKSALDGEKIDLLMMVNCNMQLLENGYMLRDVVSILIGPESLMWADGYDCENLFRIIKECPSVNNEKLSRLVVDDYITKYRRSNDQQYLDYTTIFANSLARYNDLATILKQVTKSQFPHLQDIKFIIQRLQKNYFNPVSGNSSFFLIDAGLWIKTVRDTRELRFLETSIYDHFLTLNKESVVASHVGRKLQDSDQANDLQFGYSGRSLFLPESNLYSAPRRFSYCEYLSGQLDSQFQDFTFWGEFIRKLTDR